MIDFLQTITLSAEAQTAAAGANKVINKLFTGIINPAIKLMFVVGMVYFFYSIVRRVIWEQGKSDSFGWKDGRGGVLVWGILGIFIMVAAAGLVGVLKTGILSISK